MYTGGARLAFFENLEGKAAAVSKAAAVPPPPSGESRLPEAGSARVRASGEVCSGGASHAHRSASRAECSLGTPASRRPPNQLSLKPAERLEMMWPLTVDAWTLAAAAAKLAPSLGDKGLSRSHDAGKSGRRRPLPRSGGG